MSQPEDRYEGGGIYRKTWLTRTPPLHLATDGVFAHSVVHNSSTSRCSASIPSISVHSCMVHYAISFALRYALVGSGRISYRTANASVVVAAAIENSGNVAASATIIFDLFDSTGIMAGTVTISECQVAAARNHSTPSLTTCTGILEMSVPAKLWSPSQPVLYTLRTRLSSGDEKNTTIGIYDTTWKSDTGFWMNGQHVKIRGFCNHNSRLIMPVADE